MFFFSSNNDAIKQNIIPESRFHHSLILVHSLALSLSVCLSVSLSLPPSISVFLFLSLSVTVCLSVCLSVCPTVSLPPFLSLSLSLFLLLFLDFSSMYLIYLKGKDGRGVKGGDLYEFFVYKSYQRKKLIQGKKRDQDARSKVILSAHSPRK